MEKYFGKNLKNLRDDLNLSQREISEAVCVSQSAMSQFEKGKKLPNIETAGEIAEILGVTIDDLMNTPPDDLLAAQRERRKNA